MKEFPQVEGFLFFLAVSFVNIFVSIGKSL